MSLPEVPTEAREILTACADASEFRYEGVRRELAAKLGWRVKCWTPRWSSSERKELPSCPMVSEQLNSS
jgi:hypothetical protein